MIYRVMNPINRLEWRSNVKSNANKGTKETRLKRVFFVETVFIFIETVFILDNYFICVKLCLKNSQSIVKRSGVAGMGLRAYYIHSI